MSGLGVGDGASAAAAAARGKNEGVSTPPSSPKKSKRKRDASTLRKAPQAPKRFKSCYILYHKAKHDETKAELKREAEAKGEDVAAATTVTKVSKRSAGNWKHLAADQKAYWEQEAEKDKERYEREKASYTGPWQVPRKRAKKDPSAPKRSMSAFLLFSQDHRKQIKDENPGMSNKRVSKVLGKIWRETPDEEKRPYREIELKERAKYKIRIAKWNKEKKEREDAAKKSREEQQRHFAAVQPPPPPQAPPSSAPQGSGPYAIAQSQSQAPPPMQGDPSQQQQQQQSPPQHPPPPQGYDPNMMYQQQPPPFGMPPPGAYPYHVYPPPAHGYYVPYPYPPPTTQSGQPVVLGPNGMPQGAPPPPPPQQHYIYAPQPQSVPPGAPPPTQGQYPSPSPYVAPPHHQHQHQQPPMPQEQQQQAGALAAPPPQGLLPLPYSAPPQQQQQQQHRQEAGPPAAAPLPHQVFNEDNNSGNGNLPIMPYPEPEQVLGGPLMPYPSQD